jgi:hypothetical protein
VPVPVPVPGSVPVPVPVPVPGSVALACPYLLCGLLLSFVCCVLFFYNYCYDVVSACIYIY